MALRALMLNKKISEKKKELDALREKMAGFEAREAELAQAIEEAETEEEKKTVEEAVDAFESEKKATAAEVESLETEVRELEEDLAKVEAPAPAAEPEARTAGGAPEKREENKMPTIKRRFRDMTMNERQAIIQRDDVQKFLGTIRAAMTEKRAITNAGYLVPAVVLDLLRENIEIWSKLYGRVRMVPVPGEARQVIQGGNP